MNISRRQLVIATGGVAFLGGCLGNDSSDDSSSDDSSNPERSDWTELEETDDPSNDAVDFILENNHEYTWRLDLRLLDLEVYYDDDVTIVDLEDEDGRVDERTRSKVSFEEQRETKYFTNVLDSETGYNVIMRNTASFRGDDIDSKYEEEREKHKELVNEAYENLDDSEFDGDLREAFEEGKIDDSVPKPWEETEFFRANFDWEREDPDSTLHIEITPVGEVVYEEIP